MYIFLFQIYNISLTLSLAARATNLDRRSSPIPPTCPALTSEELRARLGCPRTERSHSARLLCRHPVAPYHYQTAYRLASHRKHRVLVLLRRFIAHLLIRLIVLLVLLRLLIIDLLFSAGLLPERKRKNEWQRWRGSGPSAVCLLWHFLGTCRIYILEETSLHSLYSPPIASRLAIAPAAWQ